MTDDSTMRPDGWTPKHRHTSAELVRSPFGFALRGSQARSSHSRYGPTLTEAALRVQAAAVAADLAREKDRWRRGFTRRRGIAGAGAVGVAALGRQLLTTRAAFADPAATGRTLVVVFMRGGMDGLSVIVPANDRNLMRARPR